MKKKYFEKTMLNEKNNTLRKQCLMRKTILCKSNDKKEKQ